MRHERSERSTRGETAKASPASQGLWAALAQARWTPKLRFALAQHPLPQLAFLARPHLSPPSPTRLYRSVLTPCPSQALFRSPPSLHPAGHACRLAPLALNAHPLPGARPGPRGVSGGGGGGRAGDGRVRGEVRRQGGKLSLNARSSVLTSVVDSSLLQQERTTLCLPRLLVAKASAPCSRSSLSRLSLLALVRPHRPFSRVEDAFLTLHSTLHARGSFHPHPRVPLPGILTQQASGLLRTHYTPLARRASPLSRRSSFAFTRLFAADSPSQPDASVVIHQSLTAESKCELFIHGPSSPFPLFCLVPTASPP